MGLFRVFLLQSYKWDWIGLGWMGWVGWDLCVGLLYEHRFAVLITPMNEMLSFHFSRFCLSQSQGSRREREFCSLNLKFRDENKILLSISQGSRRDRDIFFQVSCFEMGFRDEINLILTRIFEIEKSRYALPPSWQFLAPSVTATLPLLAVIF